MSRVARQQYVPDYELYNTHYSGAGIPVFRGTHQDGSGLISDIFRKAIPILKPLAQTATKALIKTGARALTDIVTGSDVKSTLRKRALEGLKEVGRDVGGQIITGSSQGKKRKRVKARNERELLTIFLTNQQ